MLGRGRVWSAAVLFTLSLEGPPLLRCSGNCESLLQRAGATTASESAEGSSLSNLSGVREPARAGPQIKKSGRNLPLFERIFLPKQYNRKITFRRARCAVATRLTWSAGAWLPLFRRKTGHLSDPIEKVPTITP